jgi:TPR repeat protein
VHTSTAIVRGRAFSVFSRWRRVIFAVASLVTLAAAAACGASDTLARRAQALRTKAETGDASAQRDLAHLYLFGGYGVPLDYAQAKNWYTKAAEQGDAQAQVGLGILYGEGHGVPQDWTQAAAWVRKAADQQYAMGQYTLGAMYEKGQGVPQDYAEAATWYRKAAEQGHAEAQYNLGFAYDHGQGVPQDSAQAAMWFRNAAEQGFAPAQCHLGQAHARGEGVSRDSVRAYMWLSIALTREPGTEMQPCVAARDAVAATMTPTQIADARKRATEWMADFKRRQK